MTDTPLFSRRLHDPERRRFASDSYASVHPEVLEAIAAANGGHQRPYGADDYTVRLQEVAAGHFGERAQTYPVFNGTGANVVALQSMLPRWGGVVCASTAHINTDENGAPERVGGLKLLTVEAPDGKLTPELVDRQAWGWGDAHRAQALAVSITQSTELGTCYTPQEVRALAEHAHALGMRVHVDGSRIANAAAFLGTGMGAFTSEAGVDVLSFGGTKNGLLLGEAVIVLDPEASEGLDYLRKLDMQLASKMRFVSAQLIALLEGELWLRSARHANAMATHLRRVLDAAIADGSAPGLSFSQPTQANALFATLPTPAAARLHEFFTLRDQSPNTSKVRWMCSWDTKEAEVDAFAQAILAELNG